jgi:hypothetical protein
MRGRRHHNTSRHSTEFSQIICEESPIRLFQTGKVVRIDAATSSADIGNSTTAVAQGSGRCAVSDRAETAGRFVLLAEDPTQKRDCARSKAMRRLDNMNSYQP